MCPDTESNAAPQDDAAPVDKYRRKIEPAEGPNTDGLMQQIVDAHTLAPDGEAVSARDLMREEKAPSAQDDAPLPDAPQEG